MIRLIITESEIENPESEFGHDNDGQDNDLSPGREVVELMQTAAYKVIKKEDFFNKNLNEMNISGEEISLDDIDLEIGVSFVSKTVIKKYNSEWREKKSVTDVLSFPQYDFADMTDEEEKNLHMMVDSSKTISLGDVVICTARAREQAVEYGHSQEREIVYLFVHSLLHLLGRDHANDEEREKMRVEEEVIMEEMGLTR